MNKGALCISLDFEKFWGIHDVSKLKNVEQNLSKITPVIDRLLYLFNKYDIHCTWAVVGLLNHESLSNLINVNANIQFKYTNPALSPFPLSKHNLDKYVVDCFLGKSNIDKIKKIKGQELASHTYSHFYCLEKGVDEKDFEKDLRLFSTQVAKNIKSIVFPRNQINKKCLKICSENGILTYRGNQPNKYWRNTAFTNEKLTRKIGRTIDAYLKITKDNLIDWSDLKSKTEGLVNIPASRFLKPASFPTFIENLKLNRIKKQMLKSAKQNKIYHLWWHPHNFTVNTQKNFQQLEDLLIYYTQLKKEYNYQSLNMYEIAQKIG
jgi:peptidoglycan/xylan/chitin deacetylase (PgdA/CDA1 family)